jgi:hypothetical protein
MIPKSTWPASLLLAAHLVIGGISSTSADDETSPTLQPDMLVAAVPATRALAGRPRDQLWLVSCRGMFHTHQVDDLAQLNYAVHQPEGGWTNTGQEAFRSDAPVANTCILVLGNGYSAADTRSLGETAYRRLVAGLPPECGVRFLIWSWPSDHTDQGAIKDLRAKAARTPRVAFCLAHWLDEMRLPGQVSLLGTSFGARIVMEALQLRANGLGGKVNPQPRSGIEHAAVRVVLISAAMDSDWLMPGRHLSGALSQTDRLLLVNNSSDQVLKRYHWLYGRRSKAAAAGSAGVRVGGDVSDKVAQIDAAGIIGRHHGCAPYFESPSLVAAMQAYLFDTDVKSPHLPSPGLQIPVASRSAADERP